MRLASDFKSLCVSLSTEMENVVVLPARRFIVSHTITHFTDAQCFAGLSELAPKKVSPSLQSLSDIPVQICVAALEFSGRINNFS